MKAVALVAALIVLASCTEWRPQSISPETVIQRDQPGAVAVTLRDSSRIVVHQPQIVADSIVGEVDGAARRLALADVAYVAVRRSDAEGNIRVVLLASAAAAVAIAIAIGVSMQGGLW